MPPPPLAPRLLATLYYEEEKRRSVKKLLSRGRNWQEPKQNLPFLQNSLGNGPVGSMVTKQRLLFQRKFLSHFQTKFSFAWWTHFDKILYKKSYTKNSEFRSVFCPKKFENYCQNQETTVCIATSYVCTTFKKSKSELPRKLAGIYEKVLTSLAVKNGVRLLTTLLSAWGKKVVA